MNLPIYLLAQGDGVPICHNDFELFVPAKTADYFQPLNDKGKQYIILGLTSLDDISLLQTSNNLLSYIHKIGLLCSINNSEFNPQQQYTIYNLQVEQRVEIQSISIHNHPLFTVLQAKATEVIEDWTPDEEYIIEQMDDLFKTITEQPVPLDETVVQRIQKEDWELAKLDILADYISPDYASKFAYVQSLNNVERFNNVLNNTQAYLDMLTSFPKVNKDSIRKRRRSLINPTPKKRVSPTDAASIKEAYKALPIPENIREQVDREINKLETLPKNSNEYASVKDYLTWVLDIPWGSYSYEDYELNTLVNQLNETHYGLDEVKQHILEHMTIEKIRGTSEGTVLCFLGPPGTGKTSITKEIAKVTGRKLIRIALGGLSDEAELYGHRRTYVGSRPSRIITGLKTAGTLDPLILLDEVDKMSARKGDPASALLELLDKEQNNCFVDRYMEIPIDISKAMIICTANYKENIPPPLLDRMELITFKEYEEAQRLIILRDYLRPRILTDYCLDKYSIQFTETALHQISLAPQVREIERRLKKVLRMAAVDLVVRQQPKVVIDTKYIQQAAVETTKKRIGFYT